MAHVRSRHGRRQGEATRAERLAAILPLRDEGLLGVEIARTLGLSSTYVYELLNDPDGSKVRVRKDRHRGTCIDCGGPTSEYGRNGSPERCLDCRSAFQRDQKYWTRERVIESIQRFAAVHGRPPHANDWIGADPENGYPSQGSVYRTASSQTSPFATWADAIEAAGFPRPLVGVYERTPEILAKLRVPRPHTRKFDYDEARRLRTLGVPVVEIAESLGVGTRTVYRALRLAA